MFLHQSKMQIVHVSVMLITIVGTSGKTNNNTFSSNTLALKCVRESVLGAASDFGTFTQYTIILVHAKHQASIDRKLRYCTTQVRRGEEGGGV